MPLDALKRRSRRARIKRLCEVIKTVAREHVSARSQIGPSPAITCRPSCNHSFDQISTLIAERDRRDYLSCCQCPGRLLHGYQGKSGRRKTADARIAPSPNGLPHISSKKMNIGLSYRRVRRVLVGCGRLTPGPQHAVASRGKRGTTDIRG